MSTPEIDPATAASMEEDADFAGEHTEPTLHDQDGDETGSDEGRSDSGGLAPENEKPN
ncbi:hypothetical protein SAMN05421504_11382 [Amycolatopsis xylanica]|uniref:Uncharacterized protein n=1 Tax=Amycolatopsis xylanica TaxID=589385 RepID=A0A1H3SBB2_9PSEU|nr:hypothetical protein [Amycolatopsis xylanica]SDZ34997.1 hypothetical protein SAMN05421504_11382 [Amycolatopsis xylanica]